MIQTLKPENLSLLKAARNNECFQEYATSLIDPSFAGHVAEFFATDRNADTQAFQDLSADAIYCTWWLFVAYTLETNPMSIYCALLLSGECRIAWNRLALIALIEKKNQFAERQCA
ncbi:hypothetical protein [Marinomonas atlantica]|uniref:hypothetical protein n=1 Tax=Marinomonas atlantica TaxID=1806668 RepID=UPI000835198B|nr:hypothetical protein [Marinomonas atlantica]